MPLPNEALLPLSNGDLRLAQSLLQHDAVMACPDFYHEVTRWITPGGAKVELEGLLALGVASHVAFLERAILHGDFIG
jgi:hypothetical protein